MKPWLIALSLTLASSVAQAVLVDPTYRVRIKEACLARHPHRSARVQTYCGCVGTKHFRSAKAMSDARAAKRDLRWILAYYQTKSAPKLSRLVRDPNNLAEYDRFVAEACARRTRQSVAVHPRMKTRS